MIIMVEFRIKSFKNNGPYNVGKETPGETVLMRLDHITCLMPTHRQLRTQDGWTLEVFSEDWDRVEKAFRSNYLGNKVKTI
jgi:hypothetical protein